LDIRQLIAVARERRASDIHITISRNPVFRIDGTLIETDFTLSHEEKYGLIISMLEHDQREAMDRGEDVDLCFTLENGQRHRINVFRQ